MKNINLENLQMKLTKIIGKISGNKLLLSLRDTFILVSAPLMIAGFAIMINSVFLDPNGIILGDNGLNLGKMIAGSVEAWQASGFAENLRGLQDYFNLFTRGTMSINTILVVVGFAFFGTRRFFPKNRDAIIVTFYALASFFICLPWNMTTMVNGEEVVLNGVLNYEFLGQKGMFAGLIVSGLTVFFYNKLIQKNIKISMPDSVPPAVARTFESLIPGLISMAIFVVASGLTNTFFGISIPELILEMLQAPAMAVSGTAGFALFAMLGQPLLQWFGIHGSSVFGPVFGVTWDIASNENILGTAQHMFSTLFMNFSVVSSGVFTVAPLLAIYLFSKKQESKQIVKIAAAPALFNISEPTTFGIPIILNPIYFIPYVLTTVGSFFLAAFFTTIGFLPIIANNVPWTVPPIISGILYSGSWTGAVVQLIIIVLGVLVYMPFVKIANKMQLDKMQNS